MSWFAAILLPQFSLQAALRLHEEAWLQPIAIVDGDMGKGRMLEMTGPAACSGVRRGMVVTQALARCPSLRLLQRSRAQEEVVSALLLETAGMLSPFIEATAEGLCVADLRQMKACDWEQWARGVVERFAARQLRARVGVASNPDLAALAARHAEPALVVQHPGAFLAGIAVIGGGCASPRTDRHSARLGHRPSRRTLAAAAQRTRRASRPGGRRTVGARHGTRTAPIAPRAAAGNVQRSLRFRAPDRNDRAVALHPAPPTRATHLAAARGLSRGRANDADHSAGARPLQCRRRLRSL